MVVLLIFLDTLYMRKTLRATFLLAFISISNHAAMSHNTKHCSTKQLQFVTAELKYSVYIMKTRTGCILLSMTPVGVDQILPNVKLIFPPQATVTV